jgi:hypothetical protein
VARLTDKQKKRIVADYVELGTYSGAARKNKVDPKTVRKLVAADPEVVKKTRHKKEQNALSILEFMETKKDVVNDIIGKGLEILASEDKLEDASPAQITTALGTLIDKFTGVEPRINKIKADTARIGAAFGSDKTVEIADSIEDAWKKRIEGKTDEC